MDELMCDVDSMIDNLHYFVEVGDLVQAQNLANKINFVKGSKTYSEKENADSSR